MGGWQVQNQLQFNLDKLLKNNSKQWLVKKPKQRLGDGKKKDSQIWAGIKARRQTTEEAANHIDKLDDADQELMKVMLTLVQQILQDKH